MQLDRTEIVIRQRSAVELFDLSLLVMRRHLGAILLSGAIFGLPLAILNGFLTSWILTEDTYLAMEHLDAPQYWMRWRHLLHVCILFMFQFPLVSLPVTMFLGNQIFFEKADLRSTLQRLKPLLWRMFLVLGLFRFGLLCIGTEFFVDRSQEWDWLAEFWLFVIPCSVVLFIRAAWPFAPEILALELCPLRKRGGEAITYGERSRGLHRLVVSDNIARFVGAATLAVLLTLMVMALALWTKGISTNSWTWNSWCNLLVTPVALWLVGLFLSVFRFLCYLDTRIRLEGWEIELRVKAEAGRMVRKSVASAPMSDGSPSIGEREVVST